MRNCVIYILLLASLLSCKNDISTKLHLMNRQTVTFKGLEPSRFGKNISNQEILKEKKVRLVVYYDSTTCHSCKLNKLDDWTDIIQLSTLYPGKFEVMFVFAPNKDNGNLVRRTLAVNKFPHIVWFDNYYSFEKYNSFIPKDIRFHTFLLNEENQIIYVGNPLMGDKTRVLFEKMLLSEITEK